MAVIENAKLLAEKVAQGTAEVRKAVVRDDFLANSSASPLTLDNKVEDSQISERVKIFLELSGVGEASAHALAEGGYVTIGDIVADSAEEVAQKTGLSIGVARTIQMAADRYLQSE